MTPLIIPLIEVKLVNVSGQLQIYEADVREERNQQIALGPQVWQDNNAILVLWDVRSAFEGEVRLELSDDVQILAQRASVLVDGQSYVRAIEFLVILSPGQGNPISAPSLFSPSVEGVVDQNMSIRTQGNWS